LKKRKQGVDGMKCPKCSYISFDYNQICPKCNKDISEEQRKLNLPGYKPDPLFLLGALTGAASESQIGLEETFKDTSELEKEIATGMDDTGVMEREVVFGEGVEEFEMEEPLPEDMPAVDLSQIETASEAGDEEMTVDLGDLAEESEEADVLQESHEESLGTGTVVLEDVNIQEEEPVATDTLGETAEGDEISLDLDEISDEGLEAAMDFGGDEEELSLDLDELGGGTDELEEITLEPTGEFQEEVVDLADVDLQETKAAEDDSDVTYSESELLTLELEEKEKKEVSDLENLSMEETAEKPDESGS